MPDLSGLLTELTREETERLEQLVRERGQEFNVYPLSCAQQRLWFLSRLVPGPAYNIPFVYLLKGPLDVRALEASLVAVAQRHEVLRTTFVELRGDVHQVVWPAPRLAPLAVTDLRGVPSAQRKARARALAAHEAREVFDLSRGPLLRAKLFRLADEEYWLLLMLHHIVGDGWSLGVFEEELAFCYAELVDGRVPDLPELPIQYVDFAVWQQECLADESTQELLEYWRRQLAGVPRALELPTDRPRPPIQRFDGAFHSFLIPTELTSSLRRLSRDENTTLFMTLLSAFVVLLHRYSGEQDFCVGTPVAGRNRAELEKVIGCFVNMLALRADATGNPAFTELLRRVREVTLDAYEHQDLPFERLVDDLQQDRDLSRNAIFQAVFAFQNMAVLPRQFPGLQVTAVEIDNGTARFDLGLHIWEAPDGLHAMLEYCTHLFERGTIERMVQHLLALLRGIVADPHCRIGNLAMLTEAERRSALVDWNNTVQQYQRDRCVHELFEAQAERSPANQAVISDGGVLTYADLNSQANRLARHLREIGIGAGDFVGIYTDRGAAMVVSLFAVLKTGAAYVPLESRLPLARIHWILSSLRVRCLLTQGSRLAQLRDMEPVGDLRRVVCLDPVDDRDPGRFEVTDPGDWQGQPGNNLALRVEPSDLAYVIFTSGSTGTPKGVMVAHRPVINLIEWVTQSFRMGCDDQVLFITSLCFDLSVYDVFGLLAVGGSVRVVSDGDLRDPARLVEILCTEPITFWDSAPAALQQLVPFLDQAGGRTANRPLRLVFLSGDWIPLTLPGAVRSAFAGAEIIGLGGATEATVWSNWHAIDRIAPHWASIPYGRPIQNARYYVLDPEGSLCPPGVAGELYIGGECLAGGYIQQPRLTAERFVPDPFSPRPGGRLYRTGDRVRWWADGTIEFLGRLDTQVKIRGFRVELGEIEAVLAQHPQIRASAAVVREDLPGHRRLVAYVVPADPAPGIEEVRQFVRDRVPDYMLPSAFVFMDEIPATGNGKLDRARLPAPERSDQGKQPEFWAPRSEVEQALARIWADVLGVDRVGIDDNFFELGGDSILSIQVIARAHEEGLRISPRLLFQHPTVAQLAAVAGHGEVAAPQEAVAGPVPLTPIQHWFFEQGFAEPQHWNQALLLRPKQPLRAVDLVSVLGALLARHDMLRARFHRTAEGWTQEVAPPGEPPVIAQVDLTAVQPAKVPAALADTIAAAQASLDLSHGPLARADLIDLPGGEQRLLCTIHHLVVDAVSWRILLEHLELGLRQARAGAEVRLPPRTEASYKAWADRLVQYAAKSSPLQAEPSSSARWLRRDSDGENRVCDAAREIVRLDEAQTSQLTAAALQSYHLRADELVLAALAHALGRWAGTDVVAIAVERHGREDLFPELDISQTVGWFTTFCPVTLSFPPDPRPEQVITRTKETLRQVPHGGIPYGVARFLSPTGPRSAGAPLPEVTFNYLGQVDAGVATVSFEITEEAEATIQAAQSPRAKRPFLLEVTALVQDGRLEVAFSYSTAIHRRQTMHELAGRFHAVLGDLLAHCISPGTGGFTPSDFPLARLDEAKLNKLGHLIQQMDRVEVPE